MLARKGWIQSPLVGAVAFVMCGAASATVDKVICVPWQGDINKQHTIISGQAAQLKCVVKTTDTSTVYYKWVFGDGTESAPTALSGSTKYNVETTKTYTAVSGTPVTAKLQISNTNPFAMVKEDPYLMKVETDDINARINISIDKGLWWLYKNGGTSGVGSYNGSPILAWYQGSYVSTYVSPTASAVHAFAINNHKFGGNADEDPYVDAVRGGLNYLVNGYTSSSSYPALRAVAISTVNHGADGTHNPDGNANGYGIEAYGGSGDPPYQGGQVMDAIISSGVAPGASTGRDFAPGTPGSHIWTYGEVVQDMVDMYAWGQYDGAGCNGGICGSWWYGWNYGFPGDNSASQWGAIGILPAMEAPWNAVVPQWLKNYNANWLAYSMGCTGPSSAVTACTYSYFSYNGVSGCVGDSCLQTTPSGMTQMIMDGQTTADLKWQRGERYIADRWQNLTHQGSTWGGPKTYGWYSLAKAMRLAKPAAVTNLSKTSGATFDWYYGNPANATCSTEANCEQGLAPRIVEIQAADGSWSGNLTNLPLTTAWMIITLRPTVFAAAPVACFTAAPNPAFANMPIAFDPSCSSHSESGKTIANLTKFEWDWNNDGVYDASSTTPATAAHAFACATLPCSYPVKLRVTDDNNPALTATTVVTVNITNPPHPPVAKAGGPYMASMCVNDSLTLDGSGSFDPDEGLHQDGCTTCAGDTITAWDWDLTSPLDFATADKSGPVVTLSAAEFVSWLTPAGLHNIGLRVTDNTMASFPGSGQPNLTNADFDTVNVTTACMCNLAARSKSGKIQLTWSPVAGATYDIYRSTVGPNSGFAKIASNVATSYATYLDAAAINGTKYYYRVIASTGCGSQAASATASTR